MFISLKLASIASILALVSAAPAAETFDKRGLVLGTGNSVAVGNLPNYTYIYRAAGYLEHGCPAGTGVSASGCYTIKLSSDPTKNIDPAESSGTQKIQDVLLSSPSYPANGPVTKHNFKLKIGSSLTSTSAQSLPVVQLVSKEVPNGSANTVTLDLRNNKAGIYVFGVLKASVPLSALVGKSTTQEWTIKGGANGYANIVIKDSASGATILSYNAAGQNSWDSYRIRVGPRRVAESGMKAFESFWGDYYTQSL